MIEPSRQSQRQTRRNPFQLCLLTVPAMGRLTAGQGDPSLALLAILDVEL